MGIPGKLKACGQNLRPGAALEGVGGPAGWGGLGFPEERWGLRERWAGVERGDEVDMVKG